MYQSDDTQSLPANYLDQIASPIRQNKNPLFGNKILFICLGIAALIAIVLLMLSNFSGNTKPTERLAARLLAVQGVAETTTKNIKSSELRAMNTNLNLYLANTIRDIKPLLAKVDVDIDKLNKTVVQSESDLIDNLLERLEDARLNAVYDRTYAREMAYELQTILDLMKQIYKSTSSTSLKAFLNESYDNLEPTQKQFADFNSATS